MGYGAGGKDRNMGWMRREDEGKERKEKEIDRRMKEEDE